MNNHFKLFACLVFSGCLVACATKQNKPVAPEMRPEKVLLASVSDRQTEEASSNTTKTTHANKPSQPAATPHVEQAPKAIHTPKAPTVTLDPAEVERYLVQRMAMANAPDYEPYPLTFLEHTLLTKHFTLAKDPQNSIEQLNEPLKALDKVNPLSVRLNLVLAKFLGYVAKQSSDAEQKKSLAKVAEQKQYRAAAVLQSILNSGDGTSPETAYVVINIPEENAVLDHFGLRKDKQALVERNGKYYDVVTAKEKDGKTHTLYFDIDHFYGKSPSISQ